MKKCYIAGKVTGTTDYEERFSAAAKEVIELGMLPVNPVTLLHSHDKRWSSYMRESLTAMLECDCIYLLEGYHLSEGALIEFHLANKLGFEIFNQ